LSFWLFFVKKKELREQKRQVWSYRRWDGCFNVQILMPAPGLKPGLAHGTYLPARHGVPLRKAAFTTTSAHGGTEKRKEESEIATLKKKESQIPWLK